MPAPRASLLAVCVGVTLGGGVCEGGALLSGCGVQATARARARANQWFAGRVRSIAAEVECVGAWAARIGATIAHMMARTRSVGGVGVLMLAGVCAGPAAAAPTEPGTLTNKMQGAGECVKCHAFPNPQEFAGQPFITPAAAQASIMGNSARDPVFWAGVAIAHQDEPSETALCVRCHVPRAFVGGRQDAIGIDELTKDDLSGVDCELCHRLLADDATPAGNAMYEIDDVLGSDGDIPKRGPWAYDGEPPKHGYLQDTYVGESRACGTCHDVTTGRMRVDAEGAPLGVNFGEQRTFSEWKNSDYAVDGAGFKSCQDCHMPALENVAGCAEFNTQGIVHATGGRRHDLAGANRRMVEVLKGLYGAAGDKTFDDVFFDLAADNIDRMLAEAATLEVIAPAVVDLAQGISGWDVKVTNNTGHKLPSGYSEGRVMWLEVIGKVGEAVVYSSGRWLDDGLEGDAQQRTYEAHAVERASQTQFHLLKNDTWLVDSRIPAKGMKRDLETDPVGDRYALLPGDVWPNYDEVSYAFAAAQVVDATPEASGDDVMALSVRLLYVINTPEYLQFLSDENQTNMAGMNALELYEGLGAVVPLELASWSQMVPVVGLMVPEVGSSSGGEGGSSTTVTPTGGEVSTTGDGGTSGTAGTGGASSSGAGVDGESGGGGCGCRGGGGGGLLGLWWAPLLLRRRQASTSGAKRARTAAA